MAGAVRSMTRVAAAFGSMAAAARAAATGTSSVRHLHASAAAGVKVAVLDARTLAGEVAHERDFVTFEASDAVVAAVRAGAMHEEADSASEAGNLWRAGPRDDIANYDLAAELAVESGLVAVVTAPALPAAGKASTARLTWPSLHKAADAAAAAKPNGGYLTDAAPGVLAVSRIKAANIVSVFTKKDGSGFMILGESGGDTD